MAPRIKGSFSTGDRASQRSQPASRPTGFGLQPMPTHSPLGARDVLVPLLLAPTIFNECRGFAAALWQPTLGRTAWAVRFMCLNAKKFR